MNTRAPATHVDTIARWPARYQKKGGSPHEQRLAIEKAEKALGRPVPSEPWAGTGRAVLRFGDSTATFGDPNQRYDAHVQVQLGDDRKLTFRVKAPLGAHASFARTWTGSVQVVTSDDGKQFVSLGHGDEANVYDLSWDPKTGVVRFTLVQPDLYVREARIEAVVRPLKP